MPNGLHMGSLDVFWAGIATNKLHKGPGPRPSAWMGLGPVGKGPAPSPMDARAQGPGLVMEGPAQGPGLVTECMEVAPS